MLTFKVSLVIDTVGVRIMVVAAAVVIIVGVIVVGVVLLFLVTALALDVGCPRLA